MNWPNLPETYGAGERFFDMAKAAHDAAEPISYLAAFLTFFAIGRFCPNWIAICGAVVIYAVLMVPLKRSLKAARLAFHEDIRAYHEYLERLG